MAHRSDLFDPLELLFENLSAVAHHEHSGAAVPSGPPIPIAQVPGESLGQAQLGSIEIDGAGLSVILAEDRCPFPLWRRNRMVRSGDGLGHFRPAETVREELRQSAGAPVLERRLRHSDHTRVTDVT